jgi:hypothetical protein
VSFSKCKLFTPEVSLYLAAAKEDSFVLLFFIGLVGEVTLVIRVNRAGHDSSFSLQSKCWTPHFSPLFLQVKQEDCLAESQLGFLCSSLELFSILLRKEGLALPHISVQHQNQLVGSCLCPPTLPGSDVQNASLPILSPIQSKLTILEHNFPCRLNPLFIMVSQRLSTVASVAPLINPDNNLMKPSFNPLLKLSGGLQDVQPAHPPDWQPVCRRQQE